MIRDVAIDQCSAASVRHVGLSVSDIQGFEDHLSYLYWSFDAYPILGTTKASPNQAAKLLDEYGTSHPASVTARACRSASRLYLYSSS
jgi:hypothetical protein